MIYTHVLNKGGMGVQSPLDMVEHGKSKENFTAEIQDQQGVSYF